LHTAQAETFIFADTNLLLQS